MLGLNVSIATRISITLVMLTVTLFFLAQAIGLVPDRTGAVEQGRKQLCEAIALDWVLEIQKGDLDEVRAAAQAILKQNPDVLSIGLRGADGTLLVDAGSHGAQWRNPVDGASAATRVVVPLPYGPDGAPTGRLELCFQPPGAGNPLDSVGIPALGAALFLMAAGFPLYRIYLGAALRRLGAAHASGPERTAAAMNVMSEGVLLLDDRQVIVLANDALASVLGVAADDLCGRNADSLPWETPGGEGESFDSPWTQTLRDGQTRRGVPMGIRGSHDKILRYAVNVAPILGSGRTPKGVIVALNKICDSGEGSVPVQEITNELCSCAPSMGDRA